MLLQAVLRRIFIGFATLTVVSIIIFIGTSLLPGDVAEIILGQMATPESLAALREKLGMNHPCLLYTSPSPRDRTRSRMPSSA